MRRFIHYVCFVLRSKGLSGVLPRIMMLLSRFDLSGKKMKDAVAGINALGAKYNFMPAMIVPAVVLQKHRSLLQYASDSNLEFAIHGYAHKNHRPWSLEKQQQELAKAKAVFDGLGMPYCGFRAPYLSCNSNTNDALESAGLLWNSDQGFMWPYDTGGLSAQGYKLNGAIDFLYAPAAAEKTLAIPRIHGKMVCIPLVFPDDEILVDRHGIQDPERIAEIWTGVFEQTHARGDVFVLQLHPERFSFCREGMDTLLAGMTQSGKRVWVADMRKIAAWWKERSTFAFNISEQPDRRFKIQCECSERATIVGSNIADLNVPFHKAYHRISERCFHIATDGRKPCIGINNQCSDALSDFVRELGFAYELTEMDTGYGVYFDKNETYTSEDEVRILDKIEASPQPLLRFWLWPDGYESAFATSHDLDCMTLTDFVHRALGR